MKKFLFDIKYREKIDSGDYKVVCVEEPDEDGVSNEYPARIICYDHDDREFPVVALIKKDGSEKIDSFDEHGSDDAGNTLFVLSDEEDNDKRNDPVLSEKIMKILTEYFSDNYSEYAIGEATIELSNAMGEFLDTAYKNQDEVVYNNGVKDGMEKAMKNLPMWKKMKNNTLGRTLDGECVTYDAYLLRGTSERGEECGMVGPKVIVDGEVYSIKLNEILNLPVEEEEEDKNEN